MDTRVYYSREQNKKNGLTYTAGKKLFRESDLVLKHVELTLHNEDKIK